LAYLLLVAEVSHTLAAIVWVGGMFFAYVILRPSIAAMEPPARLSLLSGIFERFFVWVWACVVVLPVSGYAKVYLDYGNFSVAGFHVIVMHVLGLVMIARFIFLYFYIYRRYRQAVNDEAWPLAGELLPPIRRIIASNLLIGLVVVVVAVSGPYWG
jgi:uncharacterized membrane protein